MSGPAARLIFGFLAASYSPEPYFDRKAIHQAVVAARKTDNADIKFAVASNILAREAAIAAAFRAAAFRAKCNQLASQAATKQHARNLHLAQKAAAQKAATQAAAAQEAATQAAAAQEAAAQEAAVSRAAADLEMAVAAEEWAHAFAHTVTNYLLSEAKKLGIEGGSIARVCCIIENLMEKLQALVDLEPCATPLVSATDEFTEFVEKQFIECCLADTDEATPWDFTNHRANAVKAFRLIRHLEVILLCAVKTVSMSEMSASEPVRVGLRLTWEQKGKGPAYS